MAMAAVLAVGVVGYSAFLGTRYFDARETVSSSEIGLAAIPQIGKGVTIDEESDLDCQGQLLNGTRFNDPPSDVPHPAPPAHAAPHLSILAREQADRECQRQRLEELSALFEYPHTDDLMTIVSDIAVSSGVAVASISAGSRKPEGIAGEALYQLQPMDLTVEGETNDIYRFLRRLNGTVPVVSVEELNIGDLDRPGVTPKGQITLLFYLSPKEYVELEGQ